MVLWALVAGATAGPPQKWQPVGPHPTTNGQVEGITVKDGEVVGAIKVVAPHPASAGIV
jgi:hypothetical protein